MKTSRNGFTLVELLVSVSITSLVLVFTMNSYLSQVRGTLQLERKFFSEEEVAGLYRYIQQIGRHANWCEVQYPGFNIGEVPPIDVTVTRSTVLRCEVDMSRNPSGGTPTLVTFVFSPPNRAVQIYHGASAEPQLTFSKVSDFFVCDARIMGLKNGLDPLLQDQCRLDVCTGPFGGNCVAPAVQMGRRYISQLEGGMAILPVSEPGKTAADFIPAGGSLGKSRFFRFRIVGRWTDGADLAEKVGGHIRATEMQGAFYVRNPTPKSLGYARYLYGTVKD